MIAALSAAIGLIGLAYVLAAVNARQERERRRRALEDRIYRIDRSSRGW